MSRRGIRRGIRALSGSPTADTTPTGGDIAGPNTESTAAVDRIVDPIMDPTTDPITDPIMAPTTDPT